MLVPIRWLKDYTDVNVDADEFVRRMVLFTFNQKYEPAVVARMRRLQLPFLLQPVGNGCLNLYFGRRECLDAVRMIVDKPLSRLTPEEDFILGAMLGYDICAQCERYCKRKGQCEGKCQGMCEECINRN